MLRVGAVRCLCPLGIGNTKTARWIDVMDSYAPKCLSPEELIIQMTSQEVQELLEALALPAGTEAADRLKGLVTSTSCLETAIQLMLPERRNAA